MSRGFSASAGREDTGPRPSVAIQLAGRTEIVEIGARSPFMLVPFELGTVPAQRLREIVAHPRLPGRGEAPEAVLADCREQLPCLSCQATAFALRTAPCG